MICGPKPSLQDTQTKVKYEYKGEVMIAVSWPSSFFCVFMDQDGVEVHKHSKNDRDQHPAILT